MCCFYFVCFLFLVSPKFGFGLSRAETNTWVLCSNKESELRRKGIDTVNVWVTRKTSIVHWRFHTILTLIHALLVPLIYAT